MSESPPTLLLDVSRTVARARLPAPTGIDRVERAYIRWISARGGRFLAGFDGRQYLLDVDVVADLLGWLEDGDARPRRDLKGLLQVQRDPDLRAAQSLVRRAARFSAATPALGAALSDHMPTGGVYLNVGHDNLESVVLHGAKNSGFRNVVMIHDTIPLDHPEYARTGSPEKFRQKLQAAFNAELLLANSHDTAHRLQVHGATQRIVTTPLGIEATPRKPNKPDAPIFLCLGTIEPRKNHALLLRVWAQMWDQMADESPKLILLGRRGWENSEVFHQLDTLPMMGKTVIEAGTPDDESLSDWLSRATALLFPSHAEGYGLPVAEALEAGLPVISSDLPALREVGGAVPEYLNPDDTHAWQQMIQRFTEPDADIRAAQIQRLQSWTAPTWRAHFEIVENAIETILVQSGSAV